MYADTCEDALEAVDRFAEEFESKYRKAAKYLRHDREQLSALSIPRPSTGRTHSSGGAAQQRGAAAAGSRGVRIVNEVRQEREKKATERKGRAAWSCAPNRQHLIIGPSTSSQDLLTSWSRRQGWMS